jgi:uncharacterized OsmC-like protein
LSDRMVTKLAFVEGYNFKVQFDLTEVPTLIVDEEKPVGKGVGPNPARLLSAAVGHCLSSSLLYCLRMARVEIRNLETTVETRLARNEGGYLRVSNIDVQLHLNVDEKDATRVRRCLEIFENYCTVTESVRKGINVMVNTVQN